MSGLLASRRARLTAILVVATAAVSILAVSAAGSSVSYYVTPEEFLARPQPGADTRWRVAGRVVGESIAEQAGRRVGFSILGYEGGRVEVVYDGVYPNLFGPSTLVIVEGVADGAARLRASAVIVKHENEFVTDANDTPVYVPGKQ